MKLKYRSLLVFVALICATTFAADTSKDFDLLKKKFDEAARIDSIDQLPDIADVIAGLYEGIAVSQGGNTRFQVVAGTIIEGGSPLGSEVLGEVKSRRKASDIRLFSARRIDFKNSPVDLERAESLSLRWRKAVEKFQSDTEAAEARAAKHAEIHSAFVRQVFPQLKKEYFTAQALVVESYYNIPELLPPIFTADQESDWTTEYRRDPITGIVYFKESGKIGELGVPYALRTFYKWTFYGYLKKKSSPGAPAPK